MGCGSSQAPKILSETNGKGGNIQDAIVETVNSAKKEIGEKIENGVDSIAKAVKYR